MQEFSERTNHGIVTMQKDSVYQDALLGFAVGLLQTGGIVVAGAAMQLGIPLGISPAHVCC
jgi:hypothetical protein